MHVKHNAEFAVDCAGRLAQSLAGKRAAHRVRQDTHHFLSGSGQMQNSYSEQSEEHAELLYQHARMPDTHTAWQEPTQTQSPKYVVTTRGKTGVVCSRQLCDN